METTWLTKPKIYTVSLFTENMLTSGQTHSRCHGLQLTCGLDSPMWPWSWVELTSGLDSLMLPWSGVALGLRWGRGPQSEQMAKGLAFLWETPPPPAPRGRR